MSGQQWPQPQKSALSPLSSYAGCSAERLGPHDRPWRLCKNCLLGIDADGITIKFSRTALLALAEAAHPPFIAARIPGHLESDQAQANIRLRQLELMGRLAQIDQAAQPFPPDLERFMFKLAKVEAQGPTLPPQGAMG